MILDVEAAIRWCVLLADYYEGNGECLNDTILDVLVLLV